MRTTTKGLYALKAMVALAGGSSKDQPLALHKLAGDEGISTEFLQQIFYRLRKAGLISACRGPGGGFYLAREPADISILDVLEAAGESFVIAPCSEQCTGTRQACADCHGCEAGGFWATLEADMRRCAQSRSLADLVNRKDQAGIS